MKCILSFMGDVSFRAGHSRLAHNLPPMYQDRTCFDGRAQSDEPEHREIQDGCDRI